jgi:ribosomal protein S18 acetylase RimI-like enzyme
MKIQKFYELKNIDRLSKIIFINFFHLQNQPDITFSIDDILSTLKSDKLLGWFLLNSKNQIVGYMLGETKELPDGRYIYYLSYFYIVEKYRSMGLGYQMMMNLINYVSSINIRFIILISEINSNGYKLYRKLGFEDDPVIKLNNDNFTALLYYTF